MAKTTPKNETAVVDETATVDVTAPNGEPVEVALSEQLEAALVEAADLTAATDAAAALVATPAEPAYKEPSAEDAADYAAIQERVDASERERLGITDAIVEPLTVDDAVRALIGALQHEEEFIRAIEIRANGNIRILGNDNSGRSVRFEPLTRKAVGA